MLPAPASSQQQLCRALPWALLAQLLRGRAAEPWAWCHGQENEGSSPCTHSGKGQLALVNPNLLLRQGKHKVWSPCTDRVLHCATSCYCK